MHNNKPHYRDMRKYLITDFPISARRDSLIIYELLVKGLEPTMDRIIHGKINDIPTESDMKYQQYLIDLYNKRNNKNKEDNND